jgi:hypothetical protein
VAWDRVLEEAPIMNNTVLRRTTVETLGLLVERYPNVPIMELIDNACGAGYLTTDVELARGLNQLFVTYTQFEAAGIKP